MKNDNALMREAELTGRAAREWKHQGKKVIGTICCYIPEEIIHAADVLPYRIRATGCTDDSMGEALMSSFSCSFCSSCLELALNGTYDFLDGVVISDGCLMAQRLFDNWRYKSGLPLMHLMTVPRVLSDNAIKWYREEMVGFKEELEKLSSVTITDTNIESSIKTYNETRALIRELYDLRKKEHPLITGTESLKVILAGMSMPKEQYNDLLRQYIDDSKKNEPITDYRARLMIIGSSLDDPAYVKVIEDQGGLVVTDVQCFGSRYLWEPVEIKGDVLTSLAESYLKRPTCQRMMDQHQLMFDFMKKMAEEYNVDGIIYSTMRNCDLWGTFNLFLEERFKEANIPVLSLEREEIMTNVGQIGVRVEAFIEMLEGEGI